MVRPQTMEAALWRMFCSCNQWWFGFHFECFRQAMKKETTCAIPHSTHQVLLFLYLGVAKNSMTTNAIVSFFSPDISMKISNFLKNV